MSAADRDQATLPIGLRERVMTASLLARGAGQTVPAVPEISADEAFARAADAFYGLLGALSEDGWKTQALRGLDVQGLVGHLTGVEEDTHRALAGDPAVADAEHVESTQDQAVRQAGRSPDLTRDEWRRAAEVTLELARAAGRDLAADGGTSEHSSSEHGPPGSRCTGSGFRSATCSWSGPSSCGCTTTTSGAPSACGRPCPTRRCCA
jgi:hypothetical protein